MTKITEPEEYFRRGIQRGKVGLPHQELVDRVRRASACRPSVATIVTEGLHNRVLTTYGCGLMVE